MVLFVYVGKADAASDDSQCMNTGLIPQICTSQTTMVNTTLDNLELPVEQTTLAEYCESEGVENGDK